MWKLRVQKVSRVSGRVSEHKLSDIVQEVKHVRLVSRDSLKPRIPRVQRKSPGFCWTDSASPSLVNRLG